MRSNANNKVSLFQIKAALFQAHVDDCRDCKLATFTGLHCAEGRGLMKELNSFFTFTDKQEAA
jgi:hypothetical protein